MIEEKKLKKITLSLKNLEKDELYHLLLELSKLNKENTDFIKLKLENNPAEALLYYKEKVKQSFWSERINLKDAKKSISNFKKISKEPEYILELMIFYVENGVEIGEEYGDINEQFYTSIESMFEQIIILLNSNPNLIPLFEKRLDNILKRSCDGWGHKEALEMIYEELNVP